jgi:hypothetical protein
MYEEAVQPHLKVEALRTARHRRDSSAQRGSQIGSQMATAGRRRRSRLTAVYITGDSAGPQCVARSIRRGRRPSRSNRNWMQIGVLARRGAAENSRRFVRRPNARRALLDDYAGPAGACRRLPSVPSALRGLDTCRPVPLVTALIGARVRVIAGRNTLDTNH